MRITSKISHYHKGSVALLLAPFIWLQMYFHALQEWLFDIIYNELFKINKDSYNQVTHFIAFICLSGFSLLAYHKRLDQYISLVLYSLWLTNYYCAKFRTGLYVDKPAWVKLETKEQHWEWGLIAKNQHQAQHQFSYTDVESIVIAATTYGDESFRNQVLQIWHIHVQTKDQQRWVVYQEESIQKALNKAIELAKQFNTQVKIAESLGTHRLAETQLGVKHSDVMVWRRAFISDTVKIYKGFTTVSIFRWIKAIFSEMGDFIFIVIVSGMMQLYGFYLFVLISRFSRNPDWQVITGLELEVDWIVITEFVVTLLILLYSIYKQSRGYEILLSNHRVQYRIGGELQASLKLTQRPDFMLLKGFDKTSLIIINEENKILEVKGLEEDEYDELYEMLLTA